LKNWPSFRGPGATGVADGQNPPLTWNVESGENVAWKTPIPGLAHSAPVVWGERVFVTTAVSSAEDPPFRAGLYGDVASVEAEPAHQWRVLALDRRTGKVLWDRLAHEGRPRTKRHTKATHANSTPATDGRHVVALFGAEGLYVYDVEGQLLWHKDLGRLDAGFFFDPDDQWGYGSSPIIYKDMVIVQCDVQERSFIAAFAVKDGQELWRTLRDEIPSWGSPTAIEAGERVELVANGTRAVRAYDPRTGRELWHLKGNSEITVPTPFAAHGLIFVASGYAPVQPIWAVRPGGSGDVTPQGDAESSETVAWSKKRGGPYMPTPIAYGEHLYTCGNNGVLACYNARNGELVYKGRVAGERSAAFTASPVAADGRLYFASEEGEVYVVKAGAQYELLSTGSVGEAVLATPAIAGGVLFIRGRHHLFALGAPAP
jgi:outer membrane protein assembly factor BamB